MRISRFAGILALAAYMLVPTPSFACGDAIGWANPDTSVPAISIAAFTSKAQTELGVDVALSPVQAACGETTDFDVVDHNTKRYLGRIPVPLTKDEGNNGRILSARVNQMLKTPREQLIAIQDAYRIFHDDADALESDMGISASDGSWVNARQDQEKMAAATSQDYFVDVTLQIHCSPTQGRGGPWDVYKSLAIKTIEYILGHTDYAANTIYQKGDLRKAIFTNPDVMEALKKNLMDNTQYCPEDYHPERWVRVLERLNGSQSELIKIDPAPGRM